jgi:hypothetical protein
MNMRQFDVERLDLILGSFVTAPGGAIRNEALFHNAPDEYGMALDLLTHKGYLEKSRYGFKITYEGKMFYNKGGFAGERRRERIQAQATIVAAVCSFIGMVVSLLALFR